MNHQLLFVGNFLSQNRKYSSVNEQLVYWLRNSGWEIITVSSKTNRLMRLGDMLSTVWKMRNDFDIAHVDVYSGAAFIWCECACLLLRQLKKPYILTLHGGNLPAFALKWPHRMRRILGAADAVTAPSRYLLEQLRNYRNDLILLPNAIETKQYNFSLRKLPSANLVWLRAFHTIYNPSMAPHVVARLIQEFDDINVNMIGPDKGDGSLFRTQQVAQQLEIANRVHFPGAIAKSDVSRWLNLGDIFMNTTNVDNTPVSVLEAMACGLCVVSTNVGGLPYLLQHEHDALLVPPNDPEAMARAIRKILTEHGLAEKLSRNARKTAEQFDWSRILPQWENLFLSIRTDDQYV